MRKHISILIIILFSLNSFCQERLGISNSIYSGINGLWLNPAFIADAPFKYDINIITFHTFIDNNEVYLYKANIPIILSNTKESINAHNEYNARHNIHSKIEMYDKNNGHNKIMFQRVFLEGPSVLFGIRNWNFALTTHLREESSLVNADNVLAKVGFEGMTYQELMKKYIYLPGFSVCASAWAELGLTAATTIKRDKRKIIKGGITFKYLFGLSNAYLRNKSGYMIYQNDRDMDFYYINADYGHAIPESSAALLGQGQSIDIGFSYQKPITRRLKEHFGYFYSRGEGCPDYCQSNPYLFYNWKFSVSLLDIGYITWNRNAKSYMFTNASTTWYNFSHWAPDGLDGVDKDLNAHFNNDSTATPRKTKYTTIMPMAISAQYDYNLNGFIYINATLVQRLPHFNTPGIDRANVFSVTPRLDTRYLGIAVPLSLYQYTHPYIGFAVRFGTYLSVGTDNLNSFFTTKLSGADAYVSLRINAFNRCKKKSF